jgi:two-component system response regulator AtoC
VITTTKDHLEKSMVEGRFREDLFFRINVMSITVPPLRDRKEQILPLSQYFFNFYKTKYGKNIPPLSSKIMDIFKEYHWPGNIRELENIIKRIVLLGGEETVLQDLPGNNFDDGMNPNSLKSFPPNNSKGEVTFDLKETGKRAAEIAEKEIIQATLQDTHWNRKEAAKLLRVSYKALLYKIQKYRLDELKVPRRIEEKNA